MKISKLKYIATLLPMAQLASVHSQDYKKSVKIRPVDNYGLSFKQLTGFENGYEISLSKIEYGYRLGALRVFQKPAWPLKSDKLFFCYGYGRSEEHTSELQSRPHLVCRLLLEKKKKT